MKNCRLTLGAGVPLRLLLIVFVSLTSVAAADLPGDMAIKRMKTDGAKAAEELARAYGVDGFATDIFHKDESLLALAVQSGNTSAVRWLIDHGAKIDGHDGRGMPLWFAAFRKDTPMVRLLLRSGARPKAVQNRVILIEPAVRTSDMELTKILMDAGVKPGYQLFLLSCTDSSLAMTKLMISAEGVNAEWITRCLDFAIEKDKFDTVDYLLREKQAAVSADTLFLVLDADIRRKSAPPALTAELIRRAPDINTLDMRVFHYDPREKYGYSFEDKSALMVATFFNRPDLMRIILERGANTALTSRSKYTALHYAVFRCDPETIDVLIKAGAPLNANDIFNKAPLNYADKQCPRAIAARLEAAGAQRTILTRETRRDVRNILFYYGIPIAYTIFAVMMRESVYKDNPQDNWFGRVNGPLALGFLMGPLPAFILMQPKTLGLVGAIFAPYIAVIGGIAGVTLGILINDRFNESRVGYYATVAPIYSFTLAQFFF